MQSEQDETRLFKGKKKKKKPTPQEERVHHQHVLKEKIGQPLFFPVSLSLCCNYIQMKQMNQEAWIITKDQEVILYFFCLAAVSPDKELRLSFVFKHLSRKLNFSSLSFSLQGHLISASAIQSHNNTTGVIAMVIVVISSCMSPHASYDLTCLEIKNILDNSNFCVVCLFVSA